VNLSEICQNVNVSIDFFLMPFLGDSSSRAVVASQPGTASFAWLRILCVALTPLRRKTLSTDVRTGHD
jgi:hypothetical protein